MSLMGHERRSPHQTAARPFPLSRVSDRSGGAAQCVAKGHKRSIFQGRLTRKCGASKTLWRCNSWVELTLRVQADIPLRPFWAIAQTDALGQELGAQPVRSHPVLTPTSRLPRFDQ